MQTLSQKNINFTELTKALQHGQTFVYPTETCYGLGCDATNPEAVKKIFQIKQRREDKPCLILFPSKEIVKEYVDWNETFENLTKKHWPGALTIVAPIKPGVIFPEFLLGQENKLAFRVSSHPFVQQLFEYFQKPIVSTSANIAGAPNPYTIQMVNDSFQNEIHQPDILIDAGELEPEPPSTIVTLEQNKIKILRQGKIIIEH
jgi:L-threonylcarbamoyladenylate synthase